MKEGHLSYFTMSEKQSQLSTSELHAPKSRRNWIKSATSFFTFRLPKFHAQNPSQIASPEKKKTASQIKAYLGNEISYVSLPLNNISNGERIITLPTTMRKRANQLIESEEVLREYGDRAVGAVCPVGPFEIDFIGGETAGLDEDAEEEEEGLRKDGYRTKDIADEKPTAIQATMQIRLLSVVSEIVRNYPTHKDAVIFFEEDGMVGLAPVGIKAGDFVCRMDHCVGILREVVEDVWLIAKAMELSPLGEIDRSRRQVGFEVEGADSEKLTWDGADAEF